VVEIDLDARVGLIAYGSSHAAMVEARDMLREQGIATSYCRLRALPASDEVTHFIERHQRVYVIEQNRDGQVAMLLRSSLPGALSDRLRSVAHYNGTPIAAENVIRPILGWEKSPSGPGWPTGDVERDNPKVPHAPELSPE
jgi:2-oxoglutarate ferredoxin oxidoreductase subunit alpha